MGKTAVLAIKVLSDNRKAIKGMQETETAAGSMGRAFEKIGGLALAGAAIAGGAITALAVTGIKQAADLEQSVGAVNTVFKDSASQMHEYAEGAAEAMGLSQNSYNELATVLGTQLKNGGTSMDELADKTNGLIGLGADLASMFGGTTSDAVSALSSALKGELRQRNRHPSRPTGHLVSPVDELHDKYRRSVPPDPHLCHERPHWQHHASAKGLRRIHLSLAENVHGLR